MCCGMIKHYINGMDIHETLTVMKTKKIEWKVMIPRQKEQFERRPRHSRT